MSGFEITIAWLKESEDAEYPIGVDIWELENRRGDGSLEPSEVISDYFKDQGNPVVMLRWGDKELKLLSEFDFSDIFVDLLLFAEWLTKPSKSHELVVAVQGFNLDAKVTVESEQVVLEATRYDIYQLGPDHLKPTVEVPLSDLVDNLTSIFDRISFDLVKRGVVYLPLSIVLSRLWKLRYSMLCEKLNLT